MKDSKRGGTPSASFVVGSIAIVFLIIGYQAALFITKASVARLAANHDRPDTVYVFNSRPLEPDSVGPPSEEESRSQQYYRREYPHTRVAKSIRRANAERRYESFRFDPNTASVDDLMRLGFTQRQAESIDNYRKKGGRFRRKSDFARSYVVEDSVYKRLENYIDIPKIDINKADSAAFETLPGIGPFYASRMVSYRNELGGYSYPGQLMDIWRFDQEKYDGLKDLITVGPSEPYRLWELSEDELVKHPYIGEREARAIVIFRDNTPTSGWTVENLKKAGILDSDLAEKLSGCRIASPSP